ncbi:ADP-ribosylglycohydrolase family protein [Moraxella oblonga]|uniref:ADP-ribosylglycohydrolase family protein n=1 Tax=Moraxella oblonga TaxID=200413 RepID=UPI000837025D|nr:ADP-ribosylglycohydrolase family protein [Moraxella oblonga]
MKNLLYGSLIGTAVGDMYGLPYEGLSARRIHKMFGNRTQFALIPFIKGGMISDDTDHAVMTVQAFIASGGNPMRFGRSLKRQLMLWLAHLPAGIGMATGRSIVKMYLGVDMFGCKTGVYSAGNGSAMRASVLGVLCEDLQMLKTLNHISTTLTHTDPKAEHGAYLVALLAWVEARHAKWSEEEIWVFLSCHIDPELWELSSTYTPNERGITGYMYDTVPAVFWAWRHFRHAPLEGMAWLIRQGGDTDTTCAIFGGIVGINHYAQLTDMGRWCEPVIRPTFLLKLSEQACHVQHTQVSQRPIAFAGVRTLCRNLLFLGVVLLHGFRRLLPPY